MKQMEDGELEKILELYTQTPKQVFITLDIVWGDSYAIQLQQIVEVIDKCINKQELSCIRRIQNGTVYQIIFRRFFPGI